LAKEPPENKSGPVMSCTKMGCQSALQLKVVSPIGQTDRFGAPGTGGVQGERNKQPAKTNPPFGKPSIATGQKRKEKTNGPGDRANIEQTGGAESNTT